MQQGFLFPAGGFARPGAPLAEPGHEIIIMVIQLVISGHHSITTPIQLFIINYNFQLLTFIGFIEYCRVFNHSVCANCFKGFISTEGALRRPMTYENHNSETVGPNYLRSWLNS